MTNHNSNLQISILAIDLSKNSFQLHGVDAHGKCVLRKQLPRAKLLAFIANLPPCMIAVEACGGANHWLRKFSESGHVVQMIAPQFVKPFVKSNKSDAGRTQGSGLALCIFGFVE